MSLVDKQARFTQALAILFQYAHHRGYKITLGRGYASPEANAADGGHENSLHMSRLAQDINLFDGDGRYLTAPAFFHELHDVWDLLDDEAAPRIQNDLNHFSFEHNGMR